MPLIEKSTYSAPVFLPNGHLQTIYPYFFRKKATRFSNRRRLITHDGDFLDVDYKINDQLNSKKAIILTHGLEGNSQSSYIASMSQYFFNNDFDIFAWNMRGCSGEMNLKPYFYHSGQINDLEVVIEHVLDTGQYDEIHLIGFSLGAGMTAFYLGERNKNLPKQIQASILFSAPCCLESSGIELSKKRHKIYAETFLSTMRAKVLEKDLKMNLPYVDRGALKKVKTFQDFDNMVTAPSFGFSSAQDYYQKNSCNRVLEKIKIPTLMINAKNDPFLGKDCYPVDEAQSNPALYLEMPSQGGHIGFIGTKNSKDWAEKRAHLFIQSHR
jgi:uncharacterized protein